MRLGDIPLSLDRLDQLVEGADAAIEPAEPFPRQRVEIQLAVVSPAARAISVQRVVVGSGKPLGDVVRLLALFPCNVAVAQQGEARHSKEPGAPGEGEADDAKVWMLELQWELAAKKVHAVPALKHERSETDMYPSMLRNAGDWFADFEQLQDRIDELLTGRSMTSSIRAVGRAGAFPALNVGTWAEALEIYAFAPGIDPKPELL